MRYARFGALICLFGTALGGGGCGSHRVPGERTFPRLLTKEEVKSFLAAEKALSLGPVTTEQLQAYLSVRRKEVADRLAPFGLTPEQYWEIARNVAVARMGRVLLVDLVRRRRELAREVLAELTRAGEKKLRAELESAAGGEAECNRSWESTILANAHLIAECEGEGGVAAETEGTKPR